MFTQNSLEHLSATAKKKIPTLCSQIVTLNSRGTVMTALRHEKRYSSIGGPMCVCGKPIDWRRHTAVGDDNLWLRVQYLGAKSTDLSWLLSYRLIIFWNWSSASIESRELFEFAPPHTKILAMRVLLSDTGKVIHYSWSLSATGGRHWFDSLQSPPHSPNITPRPHHPGLLSCISTHPHSYNVSCSMDPRFIQIRCV